MSGTIWRGGWKCWKTPLSAVRTDFIIQPAWSTHSASMLGLRDGMNVFQLYWLFATCPNFKDKKLTQKIKIVIKKGLYIQWICLEKYFGPKKKFKFLTFYFLNLSPALMIFGASWSKTGQVRRTKLFCVCILTTLITI